MIESRTPDHPAAPKVSVDSAYRRGCAVQIAGLLLIVVAGVVQRLTGGAFPQCSSLRDVAVQAIAACGLLLAMSGGLFRPGRSRWVRLVEVLVGLGLFGYTAFSSFTCLARLGGF